MSAVHCSSCGKRVSNESPTDLVIRAFIECPECIQNHYGDLSELLKRLREIYLPEGVFIWLTAPHKLLKGEKPCDVWDQGRPNEVLALVAQMEDGAFV